ncbi:MAG: hypothetical protein MI742_17540, partial [Desulfobacterales bacterium]|nr:hypothetical protein [Desulfobacterales bacterium]
TLVLPENASLTGALTIEASAMECVTTSRTLPGNIPFNGTTPINLTLLALTWIEAEETRLPSGEIKITLTATAGSHRFDGTANEVRVSINNQIISGLSYDSATKSWSFTRPTDQNFSYLVQADVSKTPHNVTSGYSGRRHFRHIKGAGTPLASVIENPGLLGGTMVSPDETMAVDIPVGGLLREAHTKVTLELQHSHTSGASRINRSGLVQVLMLDQMGNPVDNSTIQELRITIPFNASAISRNGLTQNPNIQIYHAPTVEDLISGRNVKTLPKSQIISVDDTRGTVTFRVDHLTVFGVGEVTPNPAPPSSGGGGGGGGGCFINATSGDSPFALNGIGAFLLLALLAISIKTRHTRAKNASPNR